MSDGYELYTELRGKLSYLSACIDRLRERGKDYGAAERDYKMALSKRILQLRDQKIPVTIISDICRGEADIARLRFKRDVAEVQYKAAQEVINSTKLEIRIIENQIGREYGASSR